ncbi:MAG TPA: YbgC/FadM family acyl-CoA thioesterase [Dissulfurispiraceae bacterium]|nr:YbgC/FadM family acyl-CoA thioesterase [Dissulfurispiraceae bacterium]
MAHLYKTRIYYDDTDAGGVVYYGRYLSLLERARTEFLEASGISVAAFHMSGLFFVITHVDIHYRRPARLGEIVSITSEVTSMRSASLIVKNRIERDGALLVEADVTIACVDGNGRPQRLPAGFRALAPGENPESPA